jgi:hypothetical protein
MLSETGPMKKRQSLSTLPIEQEKKIRYETAAMYPGKPSQKIPTYEYFL